VVIGVRPEDLRFDTANGIPATVSVVESLGHERHVVCRLADQQLVIVRQDAHEAAPAEGSSTFLVADPHALHVFDPESGSRVGA
jgi:multiple sugar transport system ATP-binding protein